MEFSRRARRSKLEGWPRTMTLALCKKALYVLSNSFCCVWDIILVERLYVLEKFVSLFVFFSLPHILATKIELEEIFCEVRLQACFILWSRVLNAGYNNSCGSGYLCGG